MTKEKILLFEYADVPTMVLSTLTTIWGIVATTDEFIDSLERK